MEKIKELLDNGDLKGAYKLRMTQMNSRINRMKNAVKDEKRAKGERLLIQVYMNKYNFNERYTLEDFNKYPELRDFYFEKIDYKHSLTTTSLKGIKEAGQEIISNFRDKYDIDSTELSDDEILYFLMDPISDDDYKHYQDDATDLSRHVRSAHEMKDDIIRYVKDTYENSGRKIKAENKRLEAW